ncbi:hypothetical protein ABI_08470 [Asticcacaulis biprosthecium C19]|uniref:Tail fiber protein n=1 Tax=Asticcacaulis biprosthecium C19 TaxID=715226 RepID=F4QG83_9CAUL|nr:phage tail protein [Asticcacaulis biprosthecium]EGF92411.1 hypothetical protein ABI_08470 [Asticcacaulis biprosthecium C19]
MRRTTGTGHVGNMFSAGNPGLGILPTALDPDWLNSVQEEIVTVITDEDGGDEALNPADSGQLLAAIVAMMDRRDAANAAHITQIGETKEFLVEDGWDTEFYAEAIGQTVNRADYPALWALVAASSNLATSGGDKTTHRTKWGPGNGTTTFEFPDMRAVFRRVRKGALSSVAPADGAFKANQNAEHDHNVGAFAGINAGSGYSGEPFEASGLNSNGKTSEEGGDEACPDHTTVYYVIRVK